MNGVQHRVKSDERFGPPGGSVWPPRPGRRSLVETDQWWGDVEPGSPRPGRRTLDEQRLHRPRPGRTFKPQNEDVNPFKTKTRPGRNAEEDLPWEYTGSSLHKGESKESHTLKKIAPEKKRGFHAKQIEIQRDFRI